jgi:hypothetical protein
MGMNNNGYRGVPATVAAVPKTPALAFTIAPGVGALPAERKGDLVVVARADVQLRVLVHHRGRPLLEHLQGELRVSCQTQRHRRPGRQQNP